MTKTTKIVIGIIVAIIVVGGIWWFGSQTPNEKSVIKIGSIVPLTGKIAFLGQPFQKGMEQAVNEINAKGGVNGQRIELVTEDSKGDPTEGVTIANKFVSRGDITSVVVYSTAVSAAVASVFDENKIPFIAHGADTGLPLEHPYAFKTFYNSYDECKKLFNYTSSTKDMQKFGLLLPKVPWGEWCYKGIEELAGKENIVDLTYNLGETDFRTLLLKAKQKDVDGLVWVSFRPESEAISKQKAELDIKIPLLCGYKMNCVSDKSLSEVPPEYLEGYIVFDFTLAESFKKEYKDEDIIDAAFGYEAIQLIASALEKCEKIDKTCLYKQLPLVKNYSSVLNSNGFDDTKNLILNTSLFEVKNKNFVPIQ